MKQEMAKSRQNRGQTDRGQTPEPRAEPSALARMREQHRRRFVAPLLVGRRCHEDGDHTGADPEVDVVLSLAALAADAVLPRLPRFQRLLNGGGILVVAVTGETESLRRALGRSFSVVALYRQRSLAGSTITEERFAAARVMRLADGAAADRAECDLLIASHGPLPALSGGFFEAAAECADIVLGHGDPRLPTPTEPAMSPEARDLRSRAASLVDRLIDLDARHLAAHAEAEALRRDLAEARSDRASVAPGAAPAADDPPHGWPLRDDARLSPETLDLYARRPDDDFVASMRDGARFIAAHDLLGDAPSFAGAIAALNESGRRLVLDPATPDASIVIPVHAQLGYTLNCLDALLAQASRFTAEIIVVDDGSRDATPDLLPTVAGIRVHRRDVNAGFIASTNAGAAQARGRFIVMLNNDTRVMPGWLDMLIDGFALFPKAGMVGSKLLYPDGTLQEAGGIIWRDGAGWNFGRGDDPNRPCYCHARQVDYVSGASIAVPATIWRGVGGLDAHFAPAYYEDADLCFRLRAAGHETWFQPGSRVIHYEGKTSGTDTRFGAKAYQVRNAGKFLIRHRETLLAHRRTGESPLLERERQVRRRALVIEPTCPTPKQDAGSGYTIMVMRLLQALGYKPYFLPEDNFLYQPEHTAPLQHLGIECVYAPYERGFESYVRRHGALFDLALVFRVDTLARVVEPLRAAMPGAPIIFNTHDLNYLRAARAAELSGDARALSEVEDMKQRELAVMARADCVLSPSPFEVDLLARELPDSPAMALPLMTPSLGTSVGFAGRRDLCFLGGYRHPPNVDAVVYFVREVLPLIQAREPDIRFIIAGANPTDEILALARADVIVTGMIDDLRDVMDAARVFVCPLRYGAGMKGKLLTAMSYGVPVVTTSIGVEGIAAADGRHVLVADTPADFAAACLRLYRAPSLWQAMSASGQALVRRSYSPDNGRDVLRRAIDIALHRLHGIEMAEAG